MVSTNSDHGSALAPLEAHSMTGKRSNAWPLIRYERISRGLGLLVILISGAALLGWFSGSVMLKGVRSDYIPMAPNTSLVFLTFGAILAGFSFKSKRSINVIRAAALVALVLPATRLS